MDRLALLGQVPLRSSSPFFLGRQPLSAIPISGTSFPPSPPPIEFSKETIDLKIFMPDFPFSDQAASGQDQSEEEAQLICQRDAGASSAAGEDVFTCRNGDNVPAEIEPQMTEEIQTTPSMQGKPELSTYFMKPYGWY